MGILYNGIMMSEEEYFDRRPLEFEDEDLDEDDDYADAYDDRLDEDEYDDDSEPGSGFGGFDDLKPFGGFDDGFVSWGDPLGM